MRHVSTVLWLVPLAVHIGYILATSPHLPPTVGVTADESGTSARLFLAVWFAIICAANTAFIIVRNRLPNFGDAMLAVPGQKHWLSTPENKNELIERLRGICEASLLGLNVFFLAVYQSIYQANVTRPFLTMSTSVLIFFFMALPLLVSVISMFITLRGLAADARKQIEFKRSAGESIRR
ncbi:MAG: hypothetical protein GY854_20405 [Deltaproteobacteria bacterium]|nr:hypothetical protein [Deltaproteobacteria bacterium]